MPTGYTAALYEDKPQTFEEFVLACSRAMGALVTMRDDPADAEIPAEFAPSKWYDEAVVKSQAALDDALARDLDGWKRWEANRARDDERQRQEYRDKAAAIRERYEAMLAQVAEWEPPTPDHENFKQFMLDQLNESIKFDCTPFDWPIEKAIRKPQVVREEEIERLRQRLAAEEKNRDAEYERAAGRTDWVRSLRESLNGALASTTGERHTARHQESPS